MQYINGKISTAAMYEYSILWDQDLYLAESYLIKAAALRQHC